MNRKITVTGILMCAVLTSCGTASAENYENKNGVLTNPNSTAEVLILGNHSNAMKAPQSLYDELEKNLDNVVYGGYFSIINCDATPTAITVEEQNFFVEDRKNQSAVDHEISKRKTKLLKDIKENTEIPPDSAETDLLQALREAKSVLSNTESAKKKIIVADTGISTAGDFNLCNINFNENPSERSDTESIIEEYLINCEGENVLPDLTGIEVVFYGSHGNLAPCCSPQSDKMITVDEQYIAKLWENIIIRCGGSAEFKEIGGWENPITESEEIPHVSTVLFQRLLPPADPNTLDDGIVNPADIDIEIFNSEIGFSADKTELVSRDNFVNQYQELALEIQAYLSNDKSKKIYIAGAVAKFGNDNGYSLSRDRAEVIKKLLTDGSFKDKKGNEIRIDGNQIEIIGLGDKFPDKADEYPNGEFVDAIASNNRKVFIFSKPSEDNTDNYCSKLKSAYADGELNPETMKDLKKIFD